MQKDSKSQSGRTMLEMMLVLMVIGLITVAMYRSFRSTVDKASAHTLEQEVSTRVVQLRHYALRATGIQTETMEQAQTRAFRSATGVPIQTSAVGATTFTLTIGSDDMPLQNELCREVLRNFQDSSQACFDTGSCSEKNGTFTFFKFCRGGS